MSLTVPVEVPPRDREVLASWMRSPSVRAGLAQRARIVLLAADGVGTNEIVRLVGVSKPTVISWKRRYAAEGVGGLEDRPKPGRPRMVDEAAVVAATLEPPPDRLGVTHWSTRQAIRRGTFISVPDLIAAIRRYIDGWNDRCQPFTWTKTADEILPHATGGQRTSITRH